MSSPRLSNLKVRVDHLLIAGGGVVVLVASLLTWRAMRPDPAQVELEEGLDRMRDNDRVAQEPRARPPRFVRPLHTSGRSRGEQVAIPQAPPEGDPGDLDADEAVASFKQALHDLEAALESGRKLSPREQYELYNRATGSFTALSAWADAGDPTERALMDDAYAQMKSLMRELDLQPPKHDPDANPVRR
ncbi:hypothetical protein DB30_01983 [Enhygromyxa salina]|uniref:Uncharacterized protein n=1 Tax=Enhygromyxa salina TaxID=215803 RepID=A0A0C2D4H1_9BACT|nr:hypothetical protein [Enhygromyxa salina]KIG18096.1 hypothetical protein DB30_01983 [Enhygromyxa salina]